MSKVIDEAVRTLRDRLDSETIDGAIKFVILGEGTVRIDGGGVSASDSDADCTVTATREIFEGMLKGEISPASAFMTGRVNVEGDIRLAMALGSLLR
jgi:putative sterol carrier protein